MNIVTNFKFIFIMGIKNKSTLPEKSGIILILSLKLQ